jgi:ABC-type dipeptide/oligopeptide/nickel transport system permease subunit
MYVEKQRTKDLRKKVRVISIIFTVACFIALIVILSILGTSLVGKVLMIAIVIFWVVGIWQSSKRMGETVVKIENSSD